MYLVYMICMVIFWNGVRMFGIIVIRECLSMEVFGKVGEVIVIDCFVVVIGLMVLGIVGVLGVFMFMLIFVVMVRVFELFCCLKVKS